jgi:signal transduction histidine kinase
VVANNQPFVVENAPENPLVCDNLAVPDLGVVAYLGVPLVTADEYVLGSLCVIDSKPRTWTEEDLESLTDIAELVMTEIELRQQLHKLKLVEESLRTREGELRALNQMLEIRVNERTQALRTFSRKLEAEVINRKRLEQEVMRVAEAERQRIGQDLHDDLQQQLGAIAILSDMLHNQLQAEGSENAAAAKQIRQLLEGSIDSARRLARSLSPIQVKQDGLAAALAQLAESMEMVSNISCRFEAVGTVAIHDDEVATHLYRIAQEASTNAFKYAEAETITISLVAHKGEGTLRIEDDGVGISEAALTEKKGMGLHTMLYRSNLIDGRLEIKRGQQGGTAVICKFSLVPEGIPNPAVEAELDEVDLPGVAQDG